MGRFLTTRGFSLWSAALLLLATNIAVSQTVVCNEKQVEDPAPDCLDAGETTWSECEDKTNAIGEGGCFTLPVSCEASDTGTYPEKVPRECQDAPSPNWVCRTAQEDTICYEIYNCRLSLTLQECVKNNYCSRKRTNYKEDTMACVPPAE